MDQKPGVKTTEFWLALVLPQILALLVAFGVFTPAQSDALTQSVTQIAAALISGASAFGYSLSRGLAKKTDSAGTPPAKGE